jgi:hypothetical protein
MEQPQHQQQQPPQIHHGVLDGIAYRPERHRLSLFEYRGQPPVDRQSLEYLVTFLDNRDDSHEEVTAMVLRYVRLESDGGLEVLRSFCSRSD